MNSRVLLLTILLLATKAFAGQPSFDEANRLFEQGRHAEAAAIYAQVASNTPTAAAWFNLGNAQFKANELGEAIAAWKQAQRLDPRDAALRANLAFARTKVTDNRSPSIAYHALTYFTPNEWTLAAAAMLAVGFVFLVACELRRSPQKSANPAGSLGFIACGVALAGIAVASYHHVYRRVDGVIIAREAAARFGPLEDSKTAFQLTEGVEVAVQDETPGWVQVRDLAGRSGWVKRNDVYTLHPVLPTRSQ